MTSGVVSCSFHVSYCNHDTIFQPKYTRYQKAGKVKVLRCFPHCCPRHVYYRYCGAPIVVQTQFGAIESIENYISLLHIAPANLSEWALGDIIDPVDISALIKTQGSSWHVGCNKVGENNTLYSSFNQELTNGWTYSWVSSRSHVIRDCLHHAKGYIFEVLNKPKACWRLIAKVTSPGFTVETYRKHTKAEAIVAAEPVESPSPLLTLTPQSRVYFAANDGGESPRHVAKQTQIMANQLGILRLFLEQTNAIDSNMEWQQALLQHLIPSYRFKDGISVSIFQEQPEEKASIGAIYRLALEWLVHLFHPQNMQQYEAVILSHRECIYDKPELTKAYNDCIHLIHSISEEFLIQKGLTTAHLAKMIVQRIPSLEQQLQTRLDTEGYYGYHLMVAHFREVALSSNSQLSVLPNSPSMIYKGIWILNTNKSSLNVPNLSSLILSRWATWLYCFQISLSNHQLYIQSQWKMYPSQPSYFILDKKPRVLRLFPNGESTMAGGDRTIEGDYLGWVESNNQIHLMCYQYNLEFQIGLRIVFKISIQPNELSAKVVIHRLSIPMNQDMLYLTSSKRCHLWESALVDPAGSGNILYNSYEDNPSNNVEQ
ncbi:hypothetical protein THRCLA_04428 [Thraustotheca clavata]|uniref:Uncharacterized protein n=1 Tax=Thraustotheca clavata TaxID=74557 RepID=A0A1V9ZZ24_9STRA|nr:hypothetical protein THRCLA_04428 [Thraustotheca clavata]